MRENGGVGAHWTTGGQGHSVRSGIGIEVGHDARRSVCDRALAKVPEKVGDCAGGQVSKSDSQWLAAVGRGASKGGGRHNRSGADHWIGAAASVGGGEDDRITGAGGGRRTKAHKDVSGTEASQAERRSRWEAEWPSGDRRRAVA